MLPSEMASGGTATSAADATAASGDSTAFAATTHSDVTESLVDNGATDYGLAVDRFGKATVLNIFSIRRPHMRAFHFAWSGFFLAFFGWFALAPLQKRIRKDIPETAVWLGPGNNFKYQNIIAVAGTILMRLTIGPICDRFGPRIAQCSLLGVFSLPVFLVATANSYWQWTTARFFIGFIGATFVVTQFWTSLMFSGIIVGTANATSAGWGNVGGGVAQVAMPQINSLMNVVTNGNQNRAWRLSMLFPGVALILTSVAMWFLSDDLPQGQYVDLIRAGRKTKTNPTKAFGRAATNWRSWILFIVYAGCFGVELIMNANLASYFSDNQEGFGLPETTAGLMASLFGLMNLFARSIGGIASDIAAKRSGMRGRLWVYFIFQFSAGLLFILFSRIRVIGAAIPTLICFSFFAQMAGGATFSIVPFVDPPITGTIAGIVSAGANAGAVCGGFLLNPDVERGVADGFRNLGIIVVGTSFPIALLHWPQYGSMFFAPRVVVDTIQGGM